MIPEVPAWDFFTLRYAPDSAPNKAWYASTTDGGYDGGGATPLDALTELVIELAKALRNERAKTVS